MAGLIDLIARGEIEPGSSVLYAHLGGQPALNGHGGLSHEALDRLGCGSRIRSHHRTAVRWQRTRRRRAFRNAGACAEPTGDPGRAHPGRGGTRRLDSAAAVRLPGQDRLAPPGRRGEPPRGGQRREHRHRRTSPGRHAVGTGRRSHRHLRGWRRGARRRRTARAGHARHGGQRPLAAADGGGLRAARGDRGSRAASADAGDRRSAGAAERRKHPLRGRRRHQRARSARARADGGGRVGRDYLRLDDQREGRHRQFGRHRGPATRHGGAVRSPGWHRRGSRHGRDPLRRGARGGQDQVRDSRRRAGRQGERDRRPGRGRRQGHRRRHELRHRAVLPGRCDCAGCRSRQGCGRGLLHRCRKRRATRLGRCLLPGRRSVARA